MAQDTTDIARSIGDLDITSLKNEEDVSNALKQLKIVEAALKAADRFRSESVKFAMWEAHALVRAVELCGDTHLIEGKWRRMAAEWLYGLDEKTRVEFIAECKNGMTIDVVYKRMVYEPEARKALDSAVTECKQLAVEKLKKDGLVIVPEIVQTHSKKFPRSMRHEITDGVRNAVRRHGGVGIGDDNGTYVDPESNSKHIGDAMATRITAVARDIESLADLAERCESKPTYVVKGDGTRLGFCDITYIILAGVGCANVIFANTAAKKEAESLMRQIIRGDAA